MKLCRQYKVGDKVRITPRLKGPSDYPFSYVDAMAAKEGTVYQILQIFNTDDERCRINGDYHRYELKGDEAKYSWHSSMFEPYPDTKDYVSIDVPHIEINSSENKIKILL